MIFIGNYGLRPAATDVFTHVLIEMSDGMAARWMGVRPTRHRTVIIDMSNNRDERGRRDLCVRTRTKALRSGRTLPPND